MRTPRTLRMTIALIGLVAAVAPAWGQSPYPSRRYGSVLADRDGAFRMSLGAFRPEGDSDYWEDVETDFTGEIDDYENITFGAEYLLSLSRNTGLLFSGSLYEGETTHSYRGFVDNFGDRIRHDTTFGIATATIGVVFHFTPEAPVSPYIGAGGGAFFWSLVEEGDFIDFGPNPDEVFSARLEADGVAFGYYLQAGLEAPISDHLSLYAEGRWTQAEDELNGGLEDLGDVDLSGQQFSVGISWNM